MYEQTEAMWVQTHGCDAKKYKFVQYLTKLEVTIYRLLKILTFWLFFIDHKIMRSHSHSCSHTHTECPTAPKVPEMHFYFMQNNAEVGCTMVHMATQISISAMFMVYSLLGKSLWLRPCMQVFTDTQVRVGRPLNSKCTAKINCLSWNDLNHRNAQQRSTACLEMTPTIVMHGKDQLLVMKRPQPS